mmetsp:Transcript_9041/g.16842  ORF Transcript_9041/g.16842 Transcript_9041/m.16842 type:complete len:207 (-) Transcript_9041:1604-2224(-)
MGRDQVAVGRSAGRSGGDRLGRRQEQIAQVDHPVVRSAIARIAEVQTFSIVRPVVPPSLSYPILGHLPNVVPEEARHGSEHCAHVKPSECCRKFSAEAVQSRTDEALQRRRSDGSDLDGEGGETKVVDPGQKARQDLRGVQDGNQVDVRVKSLVDRQQQGQLRLDVTQREPDRDVFGHGRHFPGILYHRIRHGGRPERYNKIDLEA